MSYYRAALAAARMGNLTVSARLADYSVRIGENAPGAPRLIELLREQSFIPDDTLSVLRELVEKRKYRKALKIRLPETAKAYTIRALLYAQRGRRRAAMEQLSIALSLDTGCELPKKILDYCRGGTV